MFKVSGTYYLECAQMYFAENLLLTWYIHVEGRRAMRKNGIKDFFFIKQALRLGHGWVITATYDYGFDY